MHISSGVLALERDNWDAVILGAWDLVNVFFMAVGRSEWFVRVGWACFRESAGFVRRFPPEPEPGGIGGLRGSSSLLMLDIDGDGSHVLQSDDDPVG